MVVDAHGHLGVLPGFRFEARTPGEILQECDRVGIHRLIVAHHRDLLYEAIAGKEEIRRAFEESGGRIQAYCVFDPRRADAASVCERLLGMPAYVAIKVHPTFHETPAESAAYSPAFELARAAGVPLMAHTWFRSAHNPPQALSLPGRFRVHLERYPEVRFILGHAGGGRDGLRAAQDLLRQFPNVHVDLAGDVYEPGMIEALVAAGGLERVLFASDLPWCDPRPQLVRVLAARISDSAVAAILGGNALRVFRLEALPPGL